MSEVRFGPFLLDAGRRALMRDSTELHLSPKAFMLLEFLIAQQPNAVSKTEIHDTIWPDTFVTEATLAGVVKEIREVLADDSKSPQYIRTVHRFGYAFCGVLSSEHSPAGFIEVNGRTIGLRLGRNIVGRDPAAAVCVDDSTVSRHHAAILVESDRVSIEDLDSKNGTFVGGLRINFANLEDGRDFSVGAVRLVYRRTQLGLSTATFAAES